ncbi:PREDICTED: uncharacterized protein LOC109152134 [Ipomoea nil]|uniref:uncharacterized protein LOC109152134 n=1 Tax=Ipomoea nil TaxID=35883 RepID=UPI000901C81C|nr:PREDICTED: uncharacterized protein LOC109152134 [Ipomoea nil]
MVSEPPRRNSYAAAVSDESDQERRGATPITCSPVRSSSTTVPQRNQTPQQRSSAMEDLDNPFFLTSNGSPNVILVSPPLLGSANYASWCISMRIALEVKKKWCFVDGSVTAPVREHFQYAAWRRINLLRRFSQCDAQKISALQSEIYGLKQGNLSINDYYTKCRTLWEEMNVVRPLPVCKCEPKCSCNLVDEIRRERDTDQVIRFLQGLNDDYSSLKSNVLVLDPLPEVYKVFVMAEKLERQITLANLNLNSFEIRQANAVQQGLGLTDEIVAAVNSYTGRRNGGANKGAKCTFCGMNGHTIDKCFKKHGYPPGWIPGYKSKGKQTAAVSSSFTDNTESSLSPGTTSDQLMKLISLLQAQMAPPSNTKTTAAVSLIPQFDKDMMNLLMKANSRATDHIACSIDFFDNHHATCGAEVSLPTGNSITVKNIGDIVLNKQIRLKDDLHIPSFRFNLISDALGTTVGSAKLVNGLYLLLDSPQTKDVFRNIMAAQCNSGEIWHQRLGHFPMNKLQFLTDIKASITKNFICDACHLAKHKRSPFPLSVTTSKAIFDLVHADVWGPFPVCSLKGDSERYFLTLVDDYSRFTWLHLMKSKIEVRQFITRFHAMVFTQFGTLIKTFRTDNGTEFNNVEFFAEKGIIHQKSCAYTPQQNAVVERKHQHILNVARAIRFQATLLLEFWGQCVMHAVYIINRLPSQVIELSTPYYRLYGKDPDLMSLKVFGCLCYASNLSQSRHKMEHRGRRCIFIGIPAHTKGYLLYDLHEKTIFISKDVIFHESFFPFSQKISSTNAPEIEPTGPPLPVIPINTPMFYDLSQVQAPSANLSHNAGSSNYKFSPPQVQASSTDPLPQQNSIDETIDSNEASHEIEQCDSASPEGNNTTFPVEQPRRSDKQRRIPSKLQDYYCDAVIHRG